MKSEGYQRKRVEPSSTNASDSSDSDIPIEISIGKKPEIVTTQEQLSLNKKLNIVKDKQPETVEEDQLTSEEMALLVKTKLSKASGYKPDFSKLPKPPEEEFVVLPHVQSKLASSKKGSAPVLIEERVGPNITPEAARKSQKATYNKMLARMVGRRRQQSKK